MKRILLTVMLILGAGLLKIYPALQDSLVASANKAYNDGNYQQAAELYLSVITLGYASPELYYNLGNAFFKADDIPSAILYYEKALKLSPKDEDINFNLSLATSRIIDKIDPVPEFFLKKWWRELITLTNPDGWARAGIISFIILLAFAAVFAITKSIILRKLSFWAGATILILTLIIFMLGSQSHRSLQNEREGIVFSPTLTVKSSPSDNSVDLFVIHEGTKVQILDQIVEWSEVKIANGSVGWIRNNTYKPI
jgi:tetratricopeptide (TPR) repeat protein